ncbi:MAG TPA: phosphoribosyltransferase family protein [Rhizomicrobium sp.]|jgi:hypoxanthine phosphoribosyltransferase
MTPLFTEEQIAARIEAVAAEIVNAAVRPDFAAAILVGAFVFAADLLRALARAGLSLPFECLWLRSYGQNRTGADDIVVLSGPTDAVRGKTVLLLDGVLDKGTTLVKARELLLAQGAAAVVSAVAIDKSRDDARLVADHAAFRGVHGFLVGYGMDDAGKDRGLPYIATVD